MPMISKAAALAAAALATSVWMPAIAAERETTIAREAYICDSWAAWREYGQASLRPRGAYPSKACPSRLSPGTKVVVVEDDAGAGASEIRYRGKRWFLDNQRLK